MYHKYLTSLLSTTLLLCRDVDHRKRGILIVLGGVVAHKVNSVLPDISPYAHPWTQVHSTAHPTSGCPHQL